MSAAACARGGQDLISKGLNVALCCDRKHQRSNEHRELSLLAYLSQLQSADRGPVRPLHSLTPYQVHELSELDVYDDKQVNKCVLFVGAQHCSGIRCAPL